MKALNRYLLLMVTIFLTVGFNAGAKGKGPGNGGGGDGMTLPDGIMFRDLSEKQCLWIGGSEFVTKVPYLKSIFDRIRPLNYYLVDQLDEQIKNLDVCPYEGSLALLNTEDAKKVTSFNFKVGQKKVQLGIRWQKYLWVSMPAFRQLKDPEKKFTTEQIQAYFFVHELSHGIIPDDVEMRNEKLKGFISALSVVTTTEQLEKQMEIAQIKHFVRNSDKDFLRAIQGVRSGKFGKKRHLICG